MFYGLNLSKKYINFFFLSLMLSKILFDTKKSIQKTNYGFKLLTHQNRDKVYPLNFHVKVIVVSGVANGPHNIWDLAVYELRVV